MITNIVTKQVLNPETGELMTENFEQIHKHKDNIKRGFTMVYKSYDEAVERVITSKLDYALLISIRNMFSRTNTQRALSAIDIAKVFDTTRQKVSVLIKKMLEVRLLVKVSRLEYRLNPFMYLPYMSNGFELQKEWKEIEQSKTIMMEIDFRREDEFVSVIIEPIDDYVEEWN